MSRRLKLHLALVAGLVLCLAPSASGQSLEELWSEYPLNPAASETTAPRADATSLPTPEPKRWVLPPADAGAEAVGPTTGAPDAVPWPMIGVLSAGVLTLVLLLLGRMAPVPAVHWKRPRLAGRVAQLAVATREGSRRGSSDGARAPGSDAAPSAAAGGFDSLADAAGAPGRTR
jgi:hypothetical protein